MHLFFEHLLTMSHEFGILLGDGDTKTIKI